MRGFCPESTAAGAGGENGCPKVAVGLESSADMASEEADGHCSAVNALAVCGGCVCSAGSDAMIRCWRAGSLQSVRCACASLQLLSQPVQCSACSLVKATWMAGYCAATEGASSRSLRSMRRSCC